LDEEAERELGVAALEIALFYRTILNDPRFWCRAARVAAVEHDKASDPEGGNPPDAVQSMSRTLALNSGLPERQERSDCKHGTS